MVAEPVGAALNFLQKSYDNVTDAVLTQLYKAVDLVSQWTPNLFGSQPQIAENNAFQSGSERLIDRLRAHKYAVAVLGTALSTAVGIGAYSLYQSSEMAAKRRRLSRRKRRVPKLANGARKDVVLVVGSPTEPFTRLLALDFEKRGFIVYLTILDDKDLRYTQSNSITDDINYLNLAGNQDLVYLLAKFHLLLQTPVVPIKGAEEHHLKLSAVVFAPNLYFPLGPLENFSPASWDRVMSRMNLYTRLLTLGFLPLVRDQQSKVIVIVPNIVNSLLLAYHGPEAVFQGGVKNLFAVLSKELAPQGVSVSQVRLGNLHLSSQTSRSRVSAMVEAEIRSWNSELQDLYGTQFLNQQAKTAPASSNLSSLNLLAGLHYLLFDMIFREGLNPAVVYYGSGARMYERLSALVPQLVLRIFV